MSSSPLVFVSYAHEDAAAAARLCRDLRDAGFSPWRDEEDLLPGQDWKREIRNVLRECDRVVLLISEHSVNKRGYVQAEVREALELLREVPPGEIFVVPARLDDSEPRHRELERLHRVDLFQSWSEGLARLRRALAAPSPGGRPAFAAAHPPASPESPELTPRGRRWPLWLGLALAALLFLGWQARSIPEWSERATTLWSDATREGEAIEPPPPDRSAAIPVETSDPREASGAGDHRDEPSADPPAEDPTPPPDESEPTPSTEPPDETRKPSLDTPPEQTRTFTEKKTRDEGGTAPPPDTEPIQKSPDPRRESLELTPGRPAEVPWAGLTLTASFEDTLGVEHAVLTVSTPADLVRRPAMAAGASFTVEARDGPVRVDLLELEPRRRRIAVQLTEIGRPHP